MSSGGGGQSGVTRYDWNDQIGPYWNWTMAMGQDIAKTPYKAYGQNDYSQLTGNAQARTAGLSGDQQSAQALIRQTALGNGGLGDPTTNMGLGYVQQMLGGNKANAYAGENPYFKQTVKNANDETANAYQQGTSAELTRLMNMSGAFGGSAHQNAMANNQAALAKQLGNQTTSMYGQQYDKSAQLEESNLARQMSAIPLAYQSQGLAFDKANQLMNSGNLSRSYEQQLKDAAYGQFAEGQNWNRNNLGWLAQLLGTAQGSTGIQTQQGGYAPTNYGSQALGLGLMGRAAGLF